MLPHKEQTISFITPMSLNWGNILSSCDLSLQEANWHQQTIASIFISRNGHNKYPNLQFDSLLSKVCNEERRSCPNDVRVTFPCETPIQLQFSKAICWWRCCCPIVKGCEEKNCVVRKILLQQPQVFAVGLVWPVTNPTSFVHHPYQLKYAQSFLFYVHRFEWSTFHFNH